MSCTCSAIPDRRHGEVRVLDRDCPVHGDEVEARRVANARRAPLSLGAVERQP